MLITSDYFELGRTPSGLLDQLVAMHAETDWASNEFARNNSDLDCATIRVPFGVRQEPYQEVTETIQKYLDAFQPINDWLKTQYTEHTFVKCEMNHVGPKSQIGIHKDLCWFHEHSHRIHIPVVTNLKCFFVVGGRKYHFEVGKFYEINNRSFHHAENNGNAGRFHLVLDVIHNDQLEHARENNINISMQTVPVVNVDSYNDTGLYA